MKRISLIAALIAVIPVSGCQSGADDSQNTQNIPAQSPITAGKRIDMEEQRSEALRSAEHLSKEEQAASKREAEKAKQAAPAAAESFAKSRKTDRKQ
jgi:hypothetical protein